MTAALSEGLDRAGEEADVVVITGRPRLLCGGFDLKVIRGPTAGVCVMVSAGAELARKTYMHPQPVIIACTGHAVV
ncbi:MAG: enoyl-CoA hydratase, partial [Alphaproteobacteria bacterium]